MPKIRITLEGSQQVIAQLNALGLAGVNAVTKIQDAAAAGPGFANLGTAGRAAAAGMAAAGKSAEEAGKGFAVGRRELVGLSKALREIQLGAISSSFAPLIGIGARLGVIGAGITAVVAAFAGGTAALFKFAQGASETSQALDELAKSTNSSFESISELQQVFAQGGAPLKQFAQEFGALSEKIQEARQQLEAKRAGPELTQQANDIENLTTKFRNLASGIPQTFDPLTTLKSKAEAAVNSLAAMPLGPFGQRLQQTAEQGQEAFLKLADIFKSLSSDMERAQLGKALGLSPQTIATLSLGSEAIRRMQADVRQLGLSLNDVDKQNLSGFQRALATAGSLFDALKDKMGALASPAFTSFFEGLTQSLKEAAPALLDLARSFGELDFSALGRKIGEAGVAIAKFFTDLASRLAGGGGLQTALGQLGDSVASTATTIGTSIGQGIIDGMQQAVSAGLSALVDTIGELIAIIPQLFVAELMKNLQILKANIISLFTGTPVQPPDFSAIDAAIQRLLQNAGLAAQQIKQIPAAVQGVSSAPINALNSSLSQTAGAAQQAATAIGGIERALWRLAAAGQGVESQMWKRAAGGGGGESAIWGLPMAAGGLMGGRGTGTSDSNLALLSRGEYIMPARAVRQPGILALLETLRRSGGNLRSLLDDMSHFARGGLVLPMPAFAAGGLNTGGSSSRTLHLTIGNETFRNLSVPESTALALERFAVHSQIASTGRKPSWRR